MSRINQRILDAALEYCERGWFVVPLHGIKNGSCTCTDGASCTRKGKHPRIQWKGLSLPSREQIEEWWQQYPDSNVGLLTGSKSRLFILDVDVADGKAGDETLTRLQQIHGQLPPTLTAQTGSGGLHYYFEQTGTAKTSAGSLGRGLDTRSDRGLIVAPPSNHWSGGLYEWLGHERDLAPAPEWLLRAAQGRPVSDATQKKQSDSETNDCSQPQVECVEDGTRHDHFVRLGGKLRYSGLDEAEIFALLLSFNFRKTRNPLDLAEVKEIAESVSAYPVALKPPDMFYFPFNADKWLASRRMRRMKPIQRSFLLQLQVESWRHGGTVICRQDELWKLAWAESSAEFEEHRKTVLELTEQYGTDDDLVLVIPEIADMYVDALARWQSAKKAAEASKESRKKKAEQSA